jgi:hypothetical protein
VKRLWWIVAVALAMSSAALAQGDAAATADRRKGDIEVADVWPGGALNAKQARVVAECILAQGGYFSACQVQSETPADLQFGNMALQFLKDSKLKGSGNTGAVVRIALHFQRNAALPRRIYGQLDSMVWKAAPTWREVEAAYPRQAKADSADVQLRCGVEPSGALSHCRTLAETPARQGFAQAALSLAPAFTARFSAEETAMIAAVKTDLKFHFIRPGGGERRPMTRPQWTTRIDLEEANALFPEAARKAGIDKSAVSLRCDIAVGGRLENCSPVSETPAGLGFAQAALRVSEAMMLNPWSEDGVPVDGLSLTFPINFSGP